LNLVYLHFIFDVDLEAIAVIVIRGVTEPEFNNGMRTPLPFDTGVEHSYLLSPAHGPCFPWSIMIGPAYQVPPRSESHDDDPDSEREHKRPRSIVNPDHLDKKKISRECRLAENSIVPLVPEGTEQGLAATSIMSGQDQDTASLLAPNGRAHTN
jgi:hypothetical protein